MTEDERNTDRTRDDRTQDDRTDEKLSEQDHLTAARDAVLEAALPHVPFDGWSRATLDAAVAEAEVDAGLARLAFPRGAADLVMGFQRWGDRTLARDLDQTDLDALRIRERIAHCVRRRIEVVGEHREAVRKAAAFFALPLHAADGARAVWETADLIWTRCGDTATDYNWYTKRAILSSVMSATVLYWLGDQDPRGQATWDFLDRRIENVMGFEKVKADLKRNPLARAAFWGPGQVLKLIRAPGARGFPRTPEAER